tara:strand:- start:230 stop:520 length:291 start_codon:yes stop_codon:yes gene_type:complete
MTNKLSVLKLVELRQRISHAIRNAIPEIEIFGEGTALIGQPESEINFKIGKNSFDLFLKSDDCPASDINNDNSYMLSELEYLNLYIKQLEKKEQTQ